MHQIDRQIFVQPSMVLAETALTVVWVQPSLQVSLHASCLSLSECSSVTH